MIIRLPNGSNDPPLRMTHPFILLKLIKQSPPPPPQKKILRSRLDDKYWRVPNSKSSLSMMKTCFPRSKGCGQHLTDNHETNDKRNPLYKDSFIFSSQCTKFYSWFWKHIKFYNNDWKKKKDLAKINKISNDFMMICLSTDTPFGLQKIA